MKFEKPLTNNEKEYKISEKEVEFDFVRSSGPGGQNVNKRATKVIARWNIGETKSFSENQKQRIREVWKNKVNENDEFVVTVQEERSQHQNREIATERLNNLINSALKPQKERIPTKPTRASVERRIEEKKKKGQKKKMREKVRF